MNSSSCLDDFELRDVTKESQMILSCIVRMGQSFGAIFIVGVLKGSKSKRLNGFGFE